jgi:hypothetical protein
VSRERDKGEIVPEELFRPSLEGAHHYAYVVENIEATVERLAKQLGAGPFFLVENVPLENITSRGEPAESSITRRSATVAAARSS